MAAPEEKKPEAAKSEEPGLKSFGKWLGRKAGKTLFAVGGIAAVAGVAVLVVVVGAPALIALISGAAAVGEVGAALGASALALAPLIGGGAAVAAAGYGLARAGGEDVLNPPPPPPDTRTDFEKAYDAEVYHRKVLLDSSLNVPLQKSELDGIRDKLRPMFNENGSRKEPAADTPALAADTKPKATPTAAVTRTGP